MSKQRNMLQQVWINRDSVLKIRMNKRLKKNGKHESDADVIERMLIVLEKKANKQLEGDFNIKFDKKLF